MKRNLLALLLALVMVTGCILVSAPAVFAETATDTTEDTTEPPTEDTTEAPTEESTEAPTDEPTEEPTEESTQAPDDTDEKAAKSPIPEPFKTIFVYIIKFFKKLFAILGL